MRMTTKTWLALVRQSRLDAVAGLNLKKSADLRAMSNKASKHGFKLADVLLMPDLQLSSVLTRPKRPAGHKVGGGHKGTLATTTIASRLLSDPRFNPRTGEVSMRAMAEKPVEERQTTDPGEEYRETPAGVSPLPDASTRVYITPQPTREEMLLSFTPAEILSIFTRSVEEAEAAVQEALQAVQEQNEVREALGRNLRNTEVEMRSYQQKAYNLEKQVIALQERERDLGAKLGQADLDYHRLLEQYNELLVKAKVESKSGVRLWGNR